MSIHQRGQSFIVYYWDAGRQCTKYFGVRKYGSPEAAQQAAIAWESDRKLAVPVPGEIPTLLDLVMMYGQARDLHRHTKYTLSTILRGPAASFRDKPADELTRADLEALRTKARQAKLSPNTINKYQAYLSAALAWGVEQELIQVHPWAGFKKLPTTRKPFEATLEDFHKIIAVAPDWLVWALAVCYMTGSRPGQVELFSLRWKAIDWRRGAVTIIQGKTGRPKVVPLNHSFLAEARQRFQHDQARGFQYVIHRGNGKRIKSYRRAWLKALVKAGLAREEGKGKNKKVVPLKRIRFYDIRHCVATHMLDGGVPLPVVSSILGHSNPAVTASVYSHAIDSRRKEAVEALPELVNFNVVE